MRGIIGSITWWDNWFHRQNEKFTAEWKFRSREHNRTPKIPKLTSPNLCLSLPNSVCSHTKTQSKLSRQHSFLVSRHLTVKATHILGLDCLRRQTPGNLHRFYFLGFLFLWSAVICMYRCRIFMFVWCVSMPLHRWREGERECVYMAKSFFNPTQIYTHTRTYVVGSGCLSKYLYLYRNLIFLYAFYVIV